MDSFVLLAYASLAPSRTLFATITSLSESEDLSFCYKQKKWFLWTVAAAQAAENHVDDWGMTDTFYEGYIHHSSPNPLTKFTSNSRSTEFKDILPWNISQTITKTTSTSLRIAISYAMNWGILLWIWWKVNGNCDIWNYLTRNLNNSWYLS